VLGPTFPLGARLCLLALSFSDVVSGFFVFSWFLAVGDPGVCRCPRGFPVPVAGVAPGEAALEGVVSFPGDST